MTRPTKKEYYVELVKTVSKRGTCDRGQSGAIIILDGQIISTGYVGSAAGDDHCNEAGHKYERRIKDLNKCEPIYTHGAERSNPVIGYEVWKENISVHCVRTIHAEQNAICQAAKHGHAIKGATLYCSMVPCRACAMMIINSGIVKVVALKEYQTSQHTKDLFQKCNVELQILNSTLEEYVTVPVEVKREMKIYDVEPHNMMSEQDIIDNLVKAGIEWRQNTASCTLQVKTDNPEGLEEWNLFDLTEA